MRRYDRDEWDGARRIDRHVMQAVSADAQRRMGRWEWELTSRCLVKGEERRSCPSPKARKISPMVDSGREDTDVKYTAYCRGCVLEHVATSALILVTNPPGD